MFSPELGLLSNGKVEIDLWDVTSKVLIASYCATLPPKASKEEVSECWGPQTSESLDAFRHLGKFKYTDRQMEQEEQMEQEQSGAAIAEPSTVTGAGNKLKGCLIKYHNSLQISNQLLICQVHSGPSQSLAIHEGGQDLDASNGNMAQSDLGIATWGPEEG
ncbi:hypothetical protein EDC04DRAFT_2600238 [Pisolithus marmoratus]|nr:hypothetical protein EDC04DRAFT_2600238 [Pisolithus marmoratus]